MLREGVVGGGGIDGYFGEQGLPVGINECLERFHRECVDVVIIYCDIFHPLLLIALSVNFFLLLTLNCVAVPPTPATTCQSYLFHAHEYSRVTVPIL